jgi:hypothetical protein
MKLIVRVLGRLAVWTGYASARGRLALAQVQRRLFPMRGWQTMHIGQLAIRVPPDWGEVEVDIGGGYVVHNRPCRLRVDGDAVWYGSAIELRIRQPQRPSPAPTAPMAEFTRVIACPGGTVELALALANGVAPQARRNALKVLGSASVEPSRSPIVFGPPRPRAAVGADGALFHPRISGPPGVH